MKRARQEDEMGKIRRRERTMKKTREGGREGRGERGERKEQGGRERLKTSAK